MIRAKDYCELFCGGKLNEINKKIISEKDLVLLKEGDRFLYFSMIENNPKKPLIALVGLCPGFNQISKLVEDFNLHGDFLKAKETASFNKINKNISLMLRKIEIDKFLEFEIGDYFDFNNSEYFLITSLVKCASLKEGKGRSDEFNPLKFDFAKKCIKNKFLQDILLRNSLKKIIFFGKKNEFIINQKLIGDRSIKEILEENGKEVIVLPHPSGSNNGGVVNFLRG